MLKDIEEFDKTHAISNASRKAKGNANSVRTIVDICEEEAGEFVQNLLGISYCSLSYSGRKIDCLYLSNKLDHNDLRQCHHPKFGCKDKVSNA